MTHCGWTRRRDGSVSRPPERNKHTTSVREHAPVAAAWRAENMTNSRPACDPDHPFGTTPPCPCTETTR